MRLRIDYHGWEPADPLDQEAASVLRLLEQFAESRLQSEVGEVVASIDMYGVVQADVPVGNNSSIFLQAGDGWTAFFGPLDPVGGLSSVR